MVIIKALVDLEQKEVFIMSNSYYQCYKVTPPSNAYNLARKHADNWETFKALVEQSDGSKSEEWSDYDGDCSYEEEEDNEPEGLGIPSSP
jgi:hypothetical protein